MAASDRRSTVLALCLPGTNPPRAIGCGLRLTAERGEGDMHLSLPFTRRLGEVGNAGQKGEIGESGRGIELLESESLRDEGEIGSRRGRVPSTIGRSSLDTLICCLTTVSLKCPRCASRSETLTLRAAFSASEPVTTRLYFSLTSISSARKDLMSSR